MHIGVESALLTDAKENIQDLRKYIQGDRSEKLRHIIESSAETGIMGLAFAIGAPGYHFFLPAFTPLLLVASIFRAASKAYDEGKEGYVPFTDEEKGVRMQQALNALDTRKGLDDWEKGNPEDPVR